MVKELTDHVEIKGEKFPKEASREVLERLGAKYLKTDNFEIGGVSHLIEYVIIEELEKDYILTWKRVDSKDDRETYELHLFTSGIVKFF